MLAKHYYQAASAWVVFFVPESDADIGPYNEFMNYLGEKQRAAVAKLDERTTLFLVPPSEFSEKVLKVPGKLSISGVVLRLDNPGSNFGSHDQPQVTSYMSFHGDTSYTKPASPPSGLFLPMTSFPNLGKSGVSNVSYTGNVPSSAPPPPPPPSFSGSSHAVGGASNSINENGPEYLLHQRNPSLGTNWSPHHLQNSNSVSGARNAPLQASSNSAAADTIVQDYQPIIPKVMQGTGSSQYQTGISLGGSSKLALQETKPSVSSLQPEQLAQLASSLLGQQRQSGSSPMLSVGEDFRQSTTINPPENPFRTSQKYVVQNQLSSELSTSQFGQVQQQQKTPNVAVMPPPQTGHREVQVQGNQQPLQSTGTEEEVEADPQKRLQATLQLAAALLQQIQQGKGT